MAVPLFPWLVGIGWSRSYFATAGKTMIQETESGKEVRIGTMIRPKWNYSLRISPLRAYGPPGDMYGQYANGNQVPPGARLTNTNALIDNEIAVLQGFIVALRGSLGEFLYDDPADDSVGLNRYAVTDGISSSWQTPYTYTPTLSFDQGYLNFNRVLNSFTSPWVGASISGSGLVTVSGAPQEGYQLYATQRAASTGSTFLPGQQFATADGASTVYQLTRTIGGQATGFAEPIQNLNNSASIQVWDNGTLVTPTIGATGQVTFTSAPTAGHILSWSGKFYHRLRFKADEFEFQELFWKLWEGSKVEAVSVLL